MSKSVENDKGYLENEDARFEVRYAVKGRGSKSLQQKNLHTQLDPKFYRFGRIKSSSGTETDSF